MINTIEQAVDGPVRLIRRRGLREIVPMSDTTIWRWERDGKFPKSIKLSNGAVAWRQADVLRWIEDRAAGR